MAAVVAASAAMLEDLPSSSHDTYFLAPSGSTFAEELDVSGPIKDDDDDNDHSDYSGDEQEEEEEEEEEETDIIDEMLRQNLADDMYDPLYRSLSDPVPSGTDSEYASLMGFLDQNVPPFPIPDDLASSAVSGTVAAGTFGSEKDVQLIPKSTSASPETHAGKQESTSSRSFPFSYVDPAPCSLVTETRTGSDTVEVGVITASSQVISTGTPLQARVADIPLHVRSLSSDSDNENDKD